MYTKGQQAYFLSVRRCKKCRSKDLYIKLDPNNIQLICSNCKRFNAKIPKTVLELYVENYGDKIIDKNKSSITYEESIKRHSKIKKLKEKSLEMNEKEKKKSSDYNIYQKVHFLNKRHCHKCFSKDLVIELTGLHVKLLCKQCGTFQAFIPKPVLKMYVHKYGDSIISKDLSKIKLAELSL